MGSGVWDTGVHSGKLAAAIASGRTTFGHTHDLHAMPSGTWKAHETLDPKGVGVRESRDSDEHPNSVPITVVFDVTGSMGGIPRVLQQKLPALHGLLQRKGYVEDPQVMFGAVGDATCDRVPLQMGQWESDNRMDDALSNIFLEGGGGGGNHESYQMAAYFLARHTSTDCWEKRGKKGYVFFIGDERVYEKVDRHQVEALIGDNLQQNLSTAEIFAELAERFEVYFLFAAQGSYVPDQVVPEDAKGDGAIGWRSFLGQKALILEDANTVAETIATLVGLSEGTIDMATGLENLKDVGSDLAVVSAVSKTLAAVAGVIGEKAIVATVEGELPTSGDTAPTEGRL